MAALRAHGDDSLDPGDLARTLRRTLEARPTLARLIALLHLVLEQNLELDTAIDFKRWLGERLAAVGGELETRLGRCLAPGDGGRLLLRINAIAVGLHQMAHPTGAVAEALELDELKPL